MVLGSVRPEGRNPVRRARQTAPPCDTSGLRTVNGLGKSFRRRDDAACSLTKLAASVKPSTAAERGPRSDDDKVRNCAAPLLMPAGCGEKERKQRENTVRKPSFLAADRL